MDLSVIILSYNTKELMLQTLKSLVDARQAWKKAGVEIEVIIADNASRDGIIEAIKEEFPKFVGDSKRVSKDRYKVEKKRYRKDRPTIEITRMGENFTLIENNENRAFSSGNNVGTLFAKGRYVLFLNNDTVVPGETLPAMIKYMDENKDVGIATCRIDLWSGGLDKDCRRGFPTPWNALVNLFLKLDKVFPKSKFFGGYQYTYIPDTVEHEIDACLGAFLMIRSELGEKLDWWDEDYIFYGEDIDLCYRVKQEGYKVMYYPKVRIIHYKGAASGTKKSSRKVTKASKKTKEWVRRQSVRAMEVFYNKHYINKYPKIITWTVLLGIKVLGIYRVGRVRLFGS